MRKNCKKNNPKYLLTQSSNTQNLNIMKTLNKDVKMTINIILISQQV